MPDAATTPLPHEPLEIFAGDSISFTKTLANYPATDWSLTYRILSKQGATPITISATADGNDFSVSVDKTTSASWTPGDYWMIGFVSTSTERVQIYSEKLIINPDPAAVSNYDGRTYPEKMLELIEKVIAEGVIRETISYSYGGVSCTVQSMQDAFTIRAWLIAEIKWQQSGKPQVVVTRFF